jgi:hypothetical protein
MSNIQNTPRAKMFFVEFHRFKKVESKTPLHQAYDTRRTLPNWWQRRGS